MCGIYGVLHLDGSPADPARVSSMGRAVVHRGPDDEGLYHEGPCAIGMRRLAIIDLAGGHQPLTNQERTLWLVCNGEIYNFRELRQALSARGHRFLTGSDSEAILHAYAEYGDEFLQHLNGMFGFALWDAPRRRLLIGRDRLGIKPLYYALEGQRLTFASEAKSILAARSCSARVDRSALAEYLHWGYVPAPQCLFQGIRKLPPATLLVAEDGRLEERRYWRIPQEVDRGMSEAEWVAAVREQMERSVRMQMVSDVPIGAFLSGGLDSSAVVGYMSRAASAPVKTYSIGFEGSAADDYYNELPHARRVARLFGTDHHEILVKPDVAALLPRLLWHMDEPIADTAFLTTYLVSAFARQEVTVILSGVGGDELFGGYRRYLGSHFAARFERLPGWLRRSAVRAGRLLPSDRHSGALNAMRLAKRFLSSAELSFEERYRSYVQIAAPELLAALCGMRFDGDDALERAFAGALSEDSLNRLLTVDAETQLPDDLLLLTDKMSMATSLECRVPLLDHELVELAARMPETVKVRKGKLKHLLKIALSDLLPLDVLQRGKRGFGTPMGAWLKGSLGGLLASVLSEEAVARRGWLHYPVLRRIVTDHAANREDYTDLLLALLNLEIWSRIYLDGQAPEEVTAELKALV
ncbi:asparagine synthase (glutamine-hydrolyzing) [Pelomicrobium sp.]|jgi:asparagine synthase (glutamine-hydrolysing)|uniref:asparagine synthase (glutamine-hydrolyzing) n=1 Tax=Pelomicrobium sp. TaxID=2815319 RepID=UPI002FDE4034